MRVIITGGTGFIGRALAAELSGGHYEVILLSRNPDRAAALPRGVRVEKWDAKTATGWGGLVEGAFTIVNLAGENLAGDGFLPNRWTDERKAQLRDSRLNAGHAVVEAVAAAKVKPQSVIQISGIGHYGNRSDILTEDAAAGQDFLARLTVDWEGSTAAVTEHGVRHVVARAGVVLSPQEGALNRLVLPYRLFVGGPLGSGKQGFSWIHPQDAVAGLRFLMENPHASGPFNLTAPQPLTNEAFGRTLAKVLGRPHWLPLPGFVLKLMLGEVATTVLEGQRALPKKLLDLGFKFRFPDAEGALRDLLGKQS